jgi:hypothetical protein
VLLHDDLVILEDRRPRQDLPCTAGVIRPSLGFDLKLHAGFDAYVPMRALAELGSSNLIVVFRITPESGLGEPIYFGQRLEVLATGYKTSGFEEILGGFDLGEGRYRLDWLLRDGRQHVCSAHWVINARLTGKDRQVQLATGPGVVQPLRAEFFEQQPKPGNGPLRVKILVNLAPQEDDQGALPAEDLGLRPPERAPKNHF